MHTEHNTNPPSCLPRHIALIMDGNGRWALKKGLTRTDGHRAATRHLFELVDVCLKMDIPFLTLYTFSTENWKRPFHEVMGMFQVISDFLDAEVDNLHARNVRLRHLGRLDGVSHALQQKACRALDITRQNDGLTLTIAFNYGGRADIIDAVRTLIERGIDPDSIDETTLTTCLSTQGLPDPDLVIRTSGERRLSNFLLWETAYSLCWSTPTYWPDFRAHNLREAIADYQAYHLYYQEPHHQMHPPQRVYAVGE